MNWITPLKQAENTVTQSLDEGISPHGLGAAQILEHGTMKLYFYEPRGQDKQSPHEQD